MISKVFEIDDAGAETFLRSFTCFEAADRYKKECELEKPSLQYLIELI